MKNRWKKNYGLILLIGVAAATLGLAGCQDFIFRELMEGENGAAWAGDLAIVPAGATLTTGDDLVFSAKGGSGDYSFSIVPPGIGNTLNAGNGYYIAAFDGSDTVRVTDSKGNTSDAPLNILLGGGATPDYTVAAAPAPTFPGVGTPGGAIAGNFVIENILNDGFDTIDWRVFLSNGNATIGLGDSLVDSGAAGSLTSGAQSAVIPFAGTWPTAGGTYYLIIELGANDDQVAGNNTQASAGVTYSGTPAPNYTVVVTDPAGATAVSGSTTLESITVTNAGPGNGSVGVDWEVYLSTDTVIDGGDSLIDSGTTAVLTNPSDNASPTFNVTWPSPGSYRLVARVSAADDPSDSPGNSSALNITAPAVDYNVAALGLTGATVYQADSAIVGNFTLANNVAADDGTDTVTWSVYASLDGTLDIPGDTLVDSGSNAPLTAAGSIGVGFSGIWPSAGGSYTVFVRATAAGDSNTLDNDDSDGPHAITGSPATSPDYVVAAAPAPTFPGAGSPGGVIAGDFSIENTGTAAGSDPIAWRVYLSNGDAVLGLGDSLIDSGTYTVPTLGIGATTAVPIAFGGTWPTAGGTYYLIVELDATDDTNAANDTQASGSVTYAGAPAPDYTVVVTDPAGATAVAGSTTLESITVTNVGPGDGSVGVDWEVYLSTDTTIDGGDSLVDSGTTAVLTNPTDNESPNFNVDWPATAGNYYLLALVSASDDASDSTANSSLLAITAPAVDYNVSALGLSGATVYQADAVIDGTFTLANNVAADDGTDSVFWSVYVSLDGTLDIPGDTLVDSGTNAPLTAGGSTGLGFNGVWPSAGGDYTVFAKVTAVGDTNAVDDEDSDGAHTITPPPATSPDYIVAAVPAPSFPATGMPSTPIAGDFHIENSGTADGAALVSWRVYLSDGDAVLGMDDSLVDSGSEAALTMGGVSGAPVAFGGTWPTTSGAYYLIIELDATDDTNAANDTQASGAVTWNSPAYTVVVTDPAGATAVAGSTTLESVTITNVGPGDGSVGVDWEVYLSTDTTIDGGDSLVDSGTTAILTNPTDNESPTFNVDWPATAGNIYLLAYVTAADDATDATANSSLLAITAPAVDYNVSALGLTGATVYQADAVIDGTFTLANNVAADDGTDSVFWSVYVSLDGTLDIPGDTLVDSGTNAPLAAGGSTGIGFNGVWPSAGGDYTVFAKVTAVGDTNAVDDEDTDGAHTITPPPATSPDYIVAAAPAPNFPATGMPGSPIAGDFHIENTGTADGAALVSWRVYLSDGDAVLGMDDSLVDSGSEAALTMGGVSGAPVAFGGTWPTASGTYYLIIELDATDDTNAANDTQASGAVAWNAPAYTVVVTDPAGATAVAGSTTLESITVTNVGPGDGSVGVDWEVYLSTDTTIDGGDSLVDSGTTAVLPFPGNESPTFNVDWPATAGNIYLLAYITAADDATDATGNSSVLAITAPAVDYYPNALVLSGLTVYQADAVIDGTFTLNNDAGADDGTDSVFWSVYASLDGTLDIPGDTLVDSGTASPLSAGGSTAGINFNGVWPSAGGSYTVFVKVTAPGESDSSDDEDSSGPHGVAGPGAPDYIVQVVTNIGASDATGPITGDFVYDNVGSADGVANVLWTAYYSTNPVLNGATEVVIDSGIEGPLTTGPASANIPFTGTWPNDPGNTYYLIVEVYATDDATVNEDNNAPGDILAAAGVVDYTIENVTNVGTSVANGSADGTFVYKNSGGIAGAANVSWTAYYSTNSFLDGGTETLIDGGTVGSLGPGATSASIAFSGTWPNNPTQTYYLIVSVWSSEDIVGGEGNDGGSVLTQVDYIVQSVTNLGNKDAAGPISGQFIYRNNGTANGTAGVNWAAYYSTNATLDGATETIIDSGSEAALNFATSSAPIAFSGTWPVSPGVNHFLIVEVWSSDDAGGGQSNDGGQVLDFIDYIVPTVQHLTGTSADGSFTADFRYQNLGNKAGAASVSWTAYHSTANSLDGVTEVPVDSGIVGFLGAGSTSPPVPFSGTWPVAPGNYYLIVEVSNTEEINDTNNEGPTGGTVAVTVQNPDYLIDFDEPNLAAAQLLAADIGAPGAAVMIDNVGAGDGGQDVTYEVYYSTDTVLDGTDPLIGSGTLAGGMTVAEAPQMHPVNTTTATWPGFGIYYLIATVNASDDGNSLNDIVVSFPIAAADQVFAEGGGPNDTVGTAEPTGFVINTGISYAFEGRMENPSLAADVFRFDTNTPARDMTVVSKWRTGYDDIDIYIFDSGSTEVWSSQDVYVDQEPGGPTVLLSGFSNGTDYYLSVQFWLENGTTPSGATGERYVVLVEGQ